MSYAANTPSNCTVNRVLPKSFGETPPRNQHPRVSLASCVPAALLLSLALSGYALAAPPAHEPSDEGPWAKGRILVMPRVGLSDTEFAKILGAHGGRSARKLGNLDVHVVELPPNASEKAAARLLAKPRGKRGA